MDFAGVIGALKHGDGQLPLTGVFPNGTRVAIAQASGPVGRGPAHFTVTLRAPDGGSFARTVSGITGDCAGPGKRP